MPEFTVSPVVESPDLITIKTQPIHIPQSHGEDLGPISDFAPESWSYNPESIEEYYSKRFLAVLHRLISIALQSSWFFLSLWWDKLRGINPKDNRKRAIQLREILTRLGPAYIKIGQALSTRPDLVPPYYLDELTSLQDHIPSFPNEIAYRFIEEELGESPEAIYAEISPQPLAAASLGQVYKGKLKNGEQVAIKVQRPDLIRRITLDIYLMRNLASWAQQVFKFIRSDLVSITDELASRIFEEINYIQEGKNAEKFAKFYGYLPEIYVPKIYWKYTGRRVLTMEWIEGTKLTDIQKVQAKGINATHLVEVGVQCSLRQLLEHGFFHADPHPGNLLAMDNGQLAYLDFGMMSQIKPYQRYGLIEAVVHLVNRDFESLAYDYVKLDFLQPDTDLSPIIPALSQVFGNALGASVAELNFKSITDQMSAMMYEFPFRVPAYYALIIRSMVTLEGIAIGIDPNFKVLSKAYPYVAKRLLTDPSQELRTSLKNLLFKDGSFRWNRLENLLRNAKDSQEYDIDIVLEQATEFLFSERGLFIREYFIDEVIHAADLLGRRTWFTASTIVRKQVGLAVEETPSDFKNNGQTTEHLKNILKILQETPGFDHMHLVTIATKLLVKPEIKQMGQKIVEGLMQKVVARLIYNLLLDWDKPQDRKSTISLTKKSLYIAS
ncbi:ABC1 kinase family protein [cyanobacterium endosymbiont of Epithemia turgida]|uniref:ABC1 kinase family protein n=1 Tax=cyanobacterium endosymbiont of Epithemia turgida TaxID=718217 RepID=UPI0004D1E432|nr:AarF/ABC1/UbiB kinase family protein [cyanobacterium endosymbiont of Epithemia turgida]BAP18157.1 ABC transporter [cyanobacterium endosymbiont of Epithemia turgida isolate EtSB Lake Yunoko]